MHEMKRIIKSYLALALAVGGAMLSVSAPGQTAEKDSYQAILKREFGTAVNEMTAIEKETQDSKPDQYPRIEARLIAVLESPEATPPAKQFACQMLRTVGSPKCVSAVSKLLTDEKLSHIARFVLVGMHDPAVDAALRKALAQTDGKLRIGVINTIGDRGDRDSLKAVAALLKNKDEATSLSALNAIGKIGGTQAADALDRAKRADSLQEAWAHAYLRCAGTLAASGESSRAEKMYQLLFNGAYPASVRVAAFPAIATIQKEQAVPLIVKMLASDDITMRRAAASAVTTVPGNPATRSLVEALPALTPEGKAALLGALANRGDAQGVTEPVNRLAVDENSVVRQAAIKALARVGSAASVPVLAAALNEGGSTASAASKTLVELQGNGVTEALIKQSEIGDTVIREGVFKVLTERGQVEALPVFRKALLDKNPQIQRAALKTIAAVGTEEDLPKLVEMLVAAKSDAERDAIAQAISDVGGRIADPARRSEPVLRAWPGADGPAKVSLLRVLATWGGDKALQAVRSSLSDGAEVRKAALRALADWPDAAPMPDLLSVAKEGKEKTEQILALRGYIRLASFTRSKTKVQSYGAAMELATQPEEKWAVLAGLSEVSQVESLRMVEAYLEDAQVKREAFAAYEKIAESLAGAQPAIAREALHRVAETASDNGLRNKARVALEKLNK